ncbi:MAG TPA: zinc-dependent metalloprotease family protein [Candidatus Thermoplasmatota archaeon]
MQTRAAHRPAAVLVALAVTGAAFTAGCFAAPAADSVGSRASDIVSADTYTRLHVEVDWMEEGGASYQPNSAVLSFLEQRLEARISKPGGVTVALSNAIPATQATYSTDDLRQLERTHRDVQPGGDTMSLWVVFATVSSASTGGGVVAGIAYAGSSCAVFAKTLEENAGILSPRESMDKVVALHEVGHLMGLVNLGTPMAAPHEDAAHPGHSGNPDSVMYWQVETGNLFDLIRGGGAPDDFDADDIADLRGIGGP